MGGHTETVDAIIAEHGTGEIWTEEQEIILPFPCDKEFNKRLIWHDGDTQLYADFSQDPNIERAWHQMCPSILCVELTSSSKKVTRNWAGKTMAVMPGGMSSPAGAGGGRGGEDEKMSEDDDDDKKPRPVTPPARPPSQVFALDPNDTRLRSSGGPGNVYVSGGLLAESMRCEARAAYVVRRRVIVNMLRKETRKMTMMLVSRGGS
jgi:hypothetical protein